jgi:hypothetical protein
MASPGHEALHPVHISGASHGPASARQIWLGGAKPSGGHDPFEQYSATSHGPVAALQSVWAATGG